MKRKDIIYALAPLQALLLALSACAQQSQNRLAVGADAKVAGPMYLNYNAPSALNFLSKEAVFNQRINAAAQHTELLYYRYSPSANVFDQIEDGKSWWGMRGQLFWGSGERSIEGDAEESRFINNPFMLVQANMVFERLSFAQSLFKSKEDLASTNLPLDCAPQSAVFNARDRRLEINYDVTRFVEQTMQITKAKQDLSRLQFDLVAYNARDMGYNWIGLSRAYSVNIDKYFAPIAIDQFIHCGGSSGYPGGSNNMSPFNDKLFNLSLKALPARACIHLWRNPPRGEENPDFQVLLNFN